ncbi:hypothetical protein BQ8482_380312 [Mesorhizobium delmotii]|uniref:Uncharacterized protein n=1 Tax=Mesorhizobium delmotii TaxID=1631247 RepID=A0A2P9ASI3_9HYPH|nr:hypothetical protein BQ8482_380312 [Mesorhizobium delmotii]
MIALRSAAKSERPASFKTTPSPSMMAFSTSSVRAAAARSRYLEDQSSPRRVKIRAPSNLASCIQSSPWGGLATKVGIIGGMNSSRPGPARTGLRTESRLGPSLLAARGTERDHFTKLVMMHETAYYSSQPADTPTPRRLGPAVGCLLAAAVGPTISARMQWKRQ